MTLTLPLLDIQHLTVTFQQEGAAHLAIDDLSLRLYPGEMLGLVGESGCGKSLTSTAVMGLLPKTAHIASGQILFHGIDLLKLDAEAFRKLRGNDIALIPQDPMTSLNPVYTIGNQLAEVLTTHKGLTQQDALKTSTELLDRVRIPNAKDRLNSYPHEFSGGMRQRVMIAMALSCTPKLLIADEPTTALDVTVQAQILALMKDLIRDENTAILLITHDLGVVAEVCDRVAVMYAGQIVEEATVDGLFKAPSHPYSQGLLASLPQPGMTQLQAIPGQPPGLRLPSDSCVFEPRCPKKRSECAEHRIGVTLIETGQMHQDEHRVRCLLYEA
jgi:oligopeptide/dipeptide ABC transporter ATP-binding protein